MWIFLSNRLRTWLLLAVALPLARTVIRRARRLKPLEEGTEPVCWDFRIWHMNLLA